MKFTKLSYEFGKLLKNIRKELAMETFYFPFAAICLVWISLFPQYTGFSFALIMFSWLIIVIVNGLPYQIVLLTAQDTILWMNEKQNKIEMVSKQGGYIISKDNHFLVVPDTKQIKHIIPYIPKDRTSVCFLNLDMTISIHNKEAFYLKLEKMNHRKDVEYFWEHILDEITDMFKLELDNKNRDDTSTTSLIRELIQSKFTPSSLYEIDFHKIEILR